MNDGMKAVISGISAGLFAGAFCAIGFGVFGGDDAYDSWTVKATLGIRSPSFLWYRSEWLSEYRAANPVSDWRKTLKGLQQIHAASKGVQLTEGLPKSLSASRFLHSASLGANGISHSEIGETIC